jgi:hypothetical protein
VSARPTRSRIAILALTAWAACAAVLPRVARAEVPEVPEDPNAKTIVTPAFQILPVANYDAAAMKRLAARMATERPEEYRWQNEFEPNKPVEPLPLPTFAPPAAPTTDPAPARVQSFGYTYALRRAFRGNRSDGGNPMDPTLAVGPAHLVAMSNVHIVFYTKTGDSLGGASFSSFFSPSGTMTNLFDPRVVYDPATGRFYAICLAVASSPGSEWELAISKTSDPTAGWWIYRVSSTLDGWGIDYPYLGFGGNAVYFAGNRRATLFGWPAPMINHWNAVWVIDKGPLLSGGAAAVWALQDVRGQSGLSTPEPCARWTAPPNGFDNMLSTVEDASGQWRVLVWGVTLPSGWPGASPQLSLNSWLTTEPGAVPNAPQLGGPALLQTNNIGSPQSQFFFMNNQIHTAYHVPSGTGLLVRHLVSDVTSWPSVSGSSEDYWDGSSFHYYPSVAVSPLGDVGLVYSRSSTAEFSSALWTIKPQDDLAYQTSQYVKAGQVYYGNPGDTGATLYRWGDYSGAAPDPVTGGMWFLNLFAATGPVQGTWIGYVPHAVFVDASNSFFIHTGSKTYPWQLFPNGYNAAWNDNDLVLKAGSYHAGSAVLSKPLFIKSDGGTATITP